MPVAPEVAAVLFRVASEITIELARQEPKQVDIDWCINTFKQVHDALVKLYISG